MAGKKKGKSSWKPKKAPAHKSNLNAVELTNKLKPFRDQSAGAVTYYIVNEIRNDDGNVIQTSDIPLECEEGEQLVTAVISELLKGVAVTKHDFALADD